MNNFFTFATFVAFLALTVSSSVSIKIGAQTRILNGQQAKKGQFPWQAALIFYVNGIRYQCSGALISPDFILTAAHCLISAPTLQVILGVTNRFNVSEPGRITPTIDKVIMHELYVSESTHYDVGLIKLSAPVEYTKDIAPIRLAKRNDYLGGNEAVTIAGWGQQQEGGNGVDDLAYVRLTTITNEECVTGPMAQEPELVPEHVVCCDGSQLQQACNGDSGSALTQTGNDGKATHVGITNAIRGCGLGYPSIYTRTASFVDWVANKTELVFP